ncbi:MAG: S9 family peptidase [Chitinophagaceae bacterium]|nr:S9 family peptidase [Chitinophagaceae bacterium]MCW5929200.1 S9 family peptidase [Chitinophagaceae bacterium]
MRKVFLAVNICMALVSTAQTKKPLDHSVYDNWQSIGEKKISNDGKWIAYTINVQEGDAVLQVKSSDGAYSKNIERGYGIYMSEDSRFLICKIKPTYAETREARIKKKTNLPKDSLAIIELGKDSVLKVANIKSFSTPKKSNQWVAWLLENPVKDSATKSKPDSGISKILDSMKQRVEEVSPELAKQRKKLTSQPAVKNDFTSDNYDERFWNQPSASYPGNELVIYNFQLNIERRIPYVKEYAWSENGNILLIENDPPKDSSLEKSVSIFRSVEDRFDTISRGGNEFRNFVIDASATKIAFIAERDSSARALRKFYKLWYWQNGQDTAVMIADKNTPGMPVGWGIGEHAVPFFSKSGKRLFVGTAPIPALKDTSVADIDRVQVDVWSYKDDYLQTMQLVNLDRDLKKSYTAVIYTGTKVFVQLADHSVPDVAVSGEGDGDLALGITDVENRVAMQWEGTTLKDLYTVSLETGERKLIKKGLSGWAHLSPGGGFILWYDSKAKNYFTWKDGTIRNISSKIPVKLYAEDFDMPNDPYAYGVMGWTSGDLSVMVYDRFDIWKLDPLNVLAPVNLTVTGRKNKIRYHYIKTDPEETAIAPVQEVLLSMFNETSKHAGLALGRISEPQTPRVIMSGPYAINAHPLKAANAAVYIYTKESYIQSPDLYVNNDWKLEIRLTGINPQQSQYLWGTAELFSWRAYNGKPATGIVYKPENFDPKKRYPVICYFYEKLSDGLFNYVPPAPTPSRLNISFFVSRGYIVLAPDIEYAIGHPGKSAYDYVVSGARALVTRGWADSTKMGLQGQSWGGYQTAHIITRTKLFKAAWAGAPVSNMTSAYGGIRWQTGMNRQFQYERTQSRIGATLWQKPQLYIENSPLFHVPNITTPLVIMHNDKDGAVPWYQGIELFTAMRRLNKPVWLLNYNGEAHNLVERKNRKDIQIREQQFFDWLLKGERPAEWLRDGVPAVMKGKKWGIED